METCRYREYHMEVLRRYDLLPAEADPLLAFLVLTLGAMPVAAAVIANPVLPALGAYFHMSSQRSGPAECHMCKRLPDRRCDTVLPEESFSMAAYVNHHMSVW